MVVELLVIGGGGLAIVRCGGAGIRQRGRSWVSLTVVELVFSDGGVGAGIC